jgi:Lrp/AsnC family transcriptional regulator, leucine-responsive regulatory protein
MRLDDMDLAIVRALRTNGRLSKKQLAKQVGLTQSACWRRVDRLERKNVIQGYAALLHPSVQTTSAVQFVSIQFDRCDTMKVQQLKRALAGMPEVLEAYQIAGTWGFILKITLDEHGDYCDFFRYRLRALPEVRAVQSMFVVDVLKYVPLGLSNI